MRKGESPFCPIDIARDEHNIPVKETPAVESWRIFKIIAEFVSGFELLRKYDLAVTFFGSARCTVGDEYYEAARELAALLSHDGFAVITGGGGGIMEAANKGAYETCGKSVGLNINLPTHQEVNHSVNESQEFHYFFTRKVMLTFASEAYFFFPGGFGTLDEFFELTTLVQTGKIGKVPIILYGKDYWEPLTGWIKQDLLGKFRSIDAADTKIYTIVDSVDEAYEELHKRLGAGKQGRAGERRVFPE